MKKGRVVFIVIFTLVFIWCLIGAFFFPPAIPVVIIFYVLILIHTGKKDEIINNYKKIGKKTRDAIDIGGTALEEVGRTGAVIVVKTSKVIAGTVEQGYHAMGGEEGAKKVVEKLGQLTSATLKVATEIGIVAGKVVVEVSEHMMKRIGEEKSKSLNSSEKKLLEEYVEFVVLEDD